MKQIKPKNLTTQQQILLLEIANSNIFSDFYLSGGTALSAFYLHHRYSEDLDFFSVKEVDTLSIITFLKTHKQAIGYRSLDFQTSFNRFLIFLKFNKNIVLKTEFTYYPFPRIEENFAYLNLSIDSLVDIATNKLFTIAQKPRSRDFVDLYFILESSQITLKNLYFNAKTKFDWHIDPLQLLSRFTQIDESEFSMLYLPINLKTVQTYFEHHFKDFSDLILKK